MLLLLTAGILTAAQLCHGAVDADLDGDGNIYDAIIFSLKELELRRLAEQANPQAPTDNRPSSVCYDDLGCFDKNGTFSHLKQLPEPPETVNTQFLLYTRKNIHQPQFLDYKKPETVLGSNYNKNLPVKFITHGFGGKTNKTWVWNMKNAFLEKEDLNVIVVDWSLGSRMPYYMQAAVNTELVGAQIAVLFYLLKDKLGVLEKDIHIIGFSLGTHLAGFVGKRMMDMRGTRPARITALDPASPLFEDYGPEVHLSKDDADFVDVIHTNGDLMRNGGLGMITPIGHVDFYPNGGQRQPGCPSTLVGALKDIFGFITLENKRDRVCNHERAVDLFTDSILNPASCEYIGYPCENFDDFVLAKCMDCGQNCGRMGYNVKGTGSYYLSTKEKSPFCASLVKLTVKYAKHVKKTYGSLILTLIGLDNTKENITITEGKDDKLSPGNGKVYAIPLGSKLNPIKGMTALYLRYNGWMNWFTKGTPSFAFESVRVQDTSGKDLFHSCGDIHLDDGVYTNLDNSC